MTEPVLVPLLQRFTEVYLLDSTTVILPDALADQWAGCGGSGSVAALKLQLRLDLVGGTLSGPELQAGRQHDSSILHLLMPQPLIRISPIRLIYVSTMCWAAKPPPLF